MKKVILFSLLVLLTSNLFAQETKQNEDLKSVVSVSPFRLWNGLRVKYERVFNEKITYGGIGTVYYGTYPGFQIAPIARFYFKKNAPEGFYGQAKLLAGMFKSEFTEVALGTGESITKNESFTNFGLGFAGGYQMFWGKNDRWSIDINLGLKFVGGVPDPDVDEVGMVTSFDNAVWYTTGPGSIVDGLISIGYRF